MTEPIYIVSGFPRSGTSMMMRALEAGGIACAYSPARDRSMHTLGLIPNYDPNPHGFYELDDLNLVADWSGFRGRAVKVVRDNLDLLPASESYRVVYMRRDPAEIRRSFRGVISHETPGSFAFLDTYERDVTSDCRRFGDCTLLDYASVIADPVAAFAALNWQLDVEAAAATIDSALYRHRGAA